MIKDIQGWLDANVIHYPDPQSVNLSDFEIDWDELCGSFTLSLDSTKVESRIRFSLDSTEWIRFWMPMHHSPLGVPASYGMFEITQATQAAIDEALREAFGRFRPLGLNKDIGKLITSSTPIPERVLSDNPMAAIQTRFETHGFSVSKAVIAI